MNIILRLVVIALPVVFLGGCDATPKKGQGLAEYSRGSTNADGEDEEGQEESRPAKVGKRTRAKRVTEQKAETAPIEPDRGEEKSAAHKQETKKLSPFTRFKNAFKWTKNTK